MTVCPSCNGKSIAKILYGYAPDLMDRAKSELDKKEIVLGGCCVSDDDPKWECNDCGNLFR